MFERFTHGARETVVLAQEEARGLGHGHIGTEHLLLALLRQRGSVSAMALAGHGLDHAAARAALERLTRTDDGLDADLLGHIGIDLDAVREKAEAAFGPGALDRPRRRERPSGHIPFTRRAKKTLELALREAIALKQNHIGTGHLLLGLIREGEGLGTKILADAGIDPSALREEVRNRLRDQARDAS